MDIKLVIELIAGFVVYGLSVVFAVILTDGKDGCIFWPILLIRFLIRDFWCALFDDL